MPLALLYDDAARPGWLVLQDATDDGAPLARESVPVDRAAEAVLAKERALRPRWVWDDTARRYPGLLAAGVRVERAHDLRLCHAILRGSAFCAGSELAAAERGRWDAPRAVEAAPGGRAATLFDDEDAGPAVEAPLDVVGELRLQLDAVAASTAPGRLRLLLAAESTGALIAAEMTHDGLPWSAEAHDRILTEILGERPAGGGAVRSTWRDCRENCGRPSASRP